MVSGCDPEASMKKRSWPNRGCWLRTEGTDRQIYIAGFLPQVLGNQPQERIHVVHSKNTEIFFPLHIFIFFKVSNSQCKRFANFIDLGAQYFPHLQQECFFLYNSQKVKVIRMVGNQ